VKKLGQLCVLLAILAMVLASTYITKAQPSAENVKTYFDSGVPGIKLQVNATGETQRAQNITVILGLIGQADVMVHYLNVSVYGFVNGTSRILMDTMVDNDFALNYTSKTYNYTFTVPDHVWDMTYGEILLTYDARYAVGAGLLTLPYDLKIGFPMTHVENVYVENLEDNFRSLNATYWQLKLNYTALQGSVTDLDNTRAAVGVLAVTTVFFVATTLYMVMRRPKDYW
jgi:hypothetical protein